MAARPVVIIGTLVFTDGAHPEHPIVLPPPPILGGPGWGWVPGGPGAPPEASRPPGSIAGGPGWGWVPGGPGAPPEASRPPGVPTHPIYYPPHIWGPPGPWPTPPIAFPPGWEGGMPPHIWGPPDMPPGFWGGGMGPGVKPQPHPEHPIVIPPPPIQPGGGGDPAHPINLPPMPAPPGYHWRFVFVPFFGGWAWVLVPDGTTTATGMNKGPAYPDESEEKDEEKKV